MRFKDFFDAKFHKVFTARNMNWLGIKNGELLKLLEENFFDVFITADKNLPHQQNKKMLSVLIIILNVKRNVLKRISTLYPNILELISRPILKEIKVLNEL